MTRGYDQVLSSRPIRPLDPPLGGFFLCYIESYISGVSNARLRCLLLNIVISDAWHNLAYLIKDKGEFVPFIACDCRTLIGPTRDIGINNFITSSFFSPFGYLLSLWPLVSPLIGALQSEFLNQRFKLDTMICIILRSPICEMISSFSMCHLVSGDMYHLNMPP